MGRKRDSPSAAVSEDQEQLQQIIERIPLAIEPLYETMEPNTPIEIYSGPLTIHQQSHATGTTGRILLHWLPGSPRVVAEVAFLKRPILLGDADLQVPALGYESHISVFRSQPPFGPHWARLGGQSGAASGRADQIVFHLPNFHHYLGEPIRDTDGNQTWRGRLTLEHTDWRIDLDAVPNADRLRRKLGEDGGFALTNVGSVRRRDGGTFDIAQAIDILHALYYFLSFCRGIWCGPTLPVAFDRGRQVWRDLEQCRIRPWSERRSWFPECEYRLGSPLSDALGGFLTLWSRSEWKEPLKNLIHWYVEANTNAGGVEGGIILTQTALELLGWVYLVEDSTTCAMSSTKFGKLSAEDRIGMILQKFSVPAIVPAWFGSLGHAASSLGASSGASALVKVRNCIVHPKQSKRGKVSAIGVNARIEVLTLGIWFLELSLLHLVGYNGTYYSRLKLGSYDGIREVVPWK